MHAQKSRSILKSLILFSTLALGAVGLAQVGYGLFAATQTQERVAADLTPMVEASARHQMEAQALRSVQPLQSLFKDAAQANSALLQTAREAKRGGRADAREWATEQTRLMTAANPRLVGSYITYEPNALDGKDSQFLGNAKAGSNEAGRFAPYWTNGANGTVNYSPTTEASIQDSKPAALKPTNWWYTCPKEKRSICVTDPYDFEGTLMTSVIHPLLADGQYQGHTGSDISLNFFSELIAAANKAMYGGQGRLLLLSEDGIVAADSAGQPLGVYAKERLGARIDAVVKAIRDKKPLFERVEGGKIQFTIPFPVVDGSSTWAVLMEMPEALVMADADKVRELLAGERQRTALGQIAVGAMIVVLAIVFMSMALRRLISPISNMSTVVADIAEGEGDLTSHLPELSQDEVGMLARNLNTFIGKLRQLINEIKGSADAVHLGAGTTAASAQHNSAAIARQQHEIDQVATAVNEMAAAVQEIAQSANRAAQGATDAAQSALNGRQVVIATADQIRTLAKDIGEAGQVIARLQGESDKIGTILDVIRSIADQTNLLALNAAIEAARAGDAGRGFAVVADEVRTLAKRTQESTIEIQRMVDSMLSGTRAAVTAMERGQQRVEESVELSEEAEKALVSITGAIEGISDMNAQIATAVEEQTAVTEEVSRNITIIGQVAVDLSASADEVSQAGAQMESESKRLNGLVGRFRT